MKRKLFTIGTIVAVTLPITMAVACSDDVVSLSNKEQTARVERLISLLPTGVVKHPNPQQAVLVVYTFDMHTAVSLFGDDFDSIDTRLTTLETALNSLDRTGTKLNAGTFTVAATATTPELKNEKKQAFEFGTYTHPRNHIELRVKTNYVVIGQANVDVITRTLKEMLKKVSKEVSALVISST